MEAWIKALLGLAPTSVQSFAGGVRDRLLTMYSWVSKAFIGGFAGWLKLTAVIALVRTWVVSPVREAYETLRWLATVRVPALISIAVTLLRTWATALVNLARAELKALVATLDKWTRAAVTKIVSAFNSFRAWATTNINQTIATLTAVKNIVVALLTVPSRLASWLVAAMLKEILSYTERNFARIFAWARQRSIAYAVDTVVRIEQVLGRII